MADEQRTSAPQITNLEVAINVYMGLVAEMRATLGGAVTFSTQESGKHDHYHVGSRDRGETKYDFYVKLSRQKQHVELYVGDKESPALTFGIMLRYVAMTDHWEAVAVFHDLQTFGWQKLIHPFAVSNDKESPTYLSNQRAAELTSLLFAHQREVMDKGLYTVSP